MKHWTFEINESDSGEILISADGSDGSRWQEWINKKEGKLYESNLESMDSHKVTPVEGRRLGYQDGNQPHDASACNILSERHAKRRILPNL